MWRFTSDPDAGRGDADMRESSGGVDEITSTLVTTTTHHLTIPSDLGTNFS